MSEPTVYEATIKVQGASADDCRTAALAQIEQLGPPVGGPGYWDLIHLRIQPGRVLNDGTVVDFEAIGGAGWIRTGD